MQSPPCWTWLVHPSNEHLSFLLPALPNLHALSRMCVLLPWDEFSGGIANEGGDLRLWGDRGNEVTDDLFSPWSALVTFAMRPVLSAEAPDSLALARFTLVHPETRAGSALSLLDFRCSSKQFIVAVFTTWIKLSFTHVSDDFLNPS